MSRKPIFSNKKSFLKEKNTIFYGYTNTSVWSYKLFINIIIVYKIKNGYLFQLRFFLNGDYWNMDFIKFYVFAESSFIGQGIYKMFYKFPLIGYNTYKNPIKSPFIGKYGFHQSTPLQYLSV